MALPHQYTTAAQYFDDVAQFLKTHDWIYNYPNTDILINRVFDNFPLHWVTFFKHQSNDELSNLSLGVLSNNAPDDLKSLMNEINNLKPLYEINTNDSPQCEVRKNLKITKKKLHEIVLLSAKIREVCSEINCEFVIDIGSGLGYLPELLNEKYGYKILGLEGNSEKFQLALVRQNSLHPNTKAQIKYYHHYVTESSADEIKDTAADFFPDARNAILTGLHACADLSVTALKLFLELDFVKGLIIMPCCYHRLQLQQEGNSKNQEEAFKNFPVSDALKKTFKEHNGETFLKRYFLRLACQQSVAAFSKMNEEEHEVHAEECLFRAILEVAAREANCLVSRNKRKTGRPSSKNPDTAFDHYVSILKSTHTLAPISATSPPPLIDSPSFRERMFQKWHQHKGHCYLVEVLTALQTAIQSVCENLVLLDRVEFLRERGVGCIVHKVTDDSVSPRCYALVATKL